MDIVCGGFKMRTEGLGEAKRQLADIKAAPPALVLGEKKRLLSAKIERLKDALDALGDAE